MLNVLLGQGNDKLTITGTLDPATESYTAVTYTGALDIAPWLGTSTTWFTLTRRDGSNWAPGGANAASDFVLGQQVLLSGVAGTWRVVGVAGSVLTLERGAGAPALGTQTNVVKTVSVPGPHGGLTVVHGGGNTALSLNVAVDVAAGSVTRRDGLSWLDDGYQIGQRISIAGSATTWVVTGFADAPCTPPRAGRSRAAARARRCCSAARRSLRRRT